MNLQLNHTIVWCRDKNAAAAFLVDILGLPAPTEFGPFLVVELDNDVSLDYCDTDEAVARQHYAFLVGEEEFDRGFARIEQRGIEYWADPGLSEPGTINHHDGGRGVYFQDPEGHLLELITRPYGSGSADPRRGPVHARGTFEISMTAEPPYDEEDGINLSRVTFDKRFAGPLDATSKVHMLAARTKVEGSAGYVAIERVVGTLEGRAGTFVLQHSGTMDRGTASLSVTIVPDSGTGELAGISGRMRIEVVDKKHVYDLRYQIPA